MPKKLTPDQIEGYARDGYVCPVDAFSTERTRARRDRLEARAGLALRGVAVELGPVIPYKPAVALELVDEVAARRVRLRVPPTSPQR